MATERQAVRQAVLASTAPPYFIVKFIEDNQLCAVSVKEIVEPSPITLKEGSECVARYAEARYEAVVVATAQSFGEAKKLETLLNRQPQQTPAPQKRQTPSKPKEPIKKKAANKLRDDFTINVGSPPPQLISGSISNTKPPPDNRDPFDDLTSDSDSDIEDIPRSEDNTYHIVIWTTDVQTQTDDQEPASSTSHSCRCDQLLKVFGKFSAHVETSLKRIESELKAVQDKVYSVHDHNNY